MLSREGTAIHRVYEALEVSNGNVSRRAEGSVSRATAFANPAVVGGQHFVIALVGSVRALPNLDKAMSGSGSTVSTALIWLQYSRATGKSRRAAGSEVDSTLLVLQREVMYPKRVFGKGAWGR